jgi:hypothetical protein
LKERLKHDFGSLEADLASRDSNSNNETDSNKYEGGDKEGAPDQAAPAGSSLVDPPAANAEAADEAEDGQRIDD